MSDKQPPPLPDGWVELSRTGSGFVRAAYKWAKDRWTVVEVCYNPKQGWVNDSDCVEDTELSADEIRALAAAVEAAQ